MSTQNVNQYNEMNVMEKAEARASWLWAQNFNMAKPNGDRYLNIEELAKSIYDLEIQKLKDDEESLFVEKRLIPDKNIPEIEE